MAQNIQQWPIDKLVFYARNPRKNDAAVDRMVASIQEYGFKIPVLACSSGEVVDGHLRLKAADKLMSDADVKLLPQLKTSLEDLHQTLGAVELHGIGSCKARFV